MPQEITYNEWCSKWGVTRWYHEDGSARTLLPLDYNWKHVYDTVTAEADLHFARYPIDDPFEFGEEFLTEIPTAWLKYKTMIELMLGTLDGKTIDPLMFEAGYTRETTAETRRDTQQDSGSSSNRNITENTDTTAKVDTSLDQTEDRDITSNNTHNGSTTYGQIDQGTDTANRSLNYVQGVQGLNAPTAGNIGEMGLRYASNMVDNIGNTDTSTKEHTDTNSSTDKTTTDDTLKTTGTQNETGSSNTSHTNRDTYSDSRNITTDDDVDFHELVHETRINYYDNLAFLRDRSDRLKLIQPFWSYLEDCFHSVSGLEETWW